jgi:hypothetical protein
MVRQVRRGFCVVRCDLDMMQGEELEDGMNEWSLEFGVVLSSNCHLTRRRTAVNLCRWLAARARRRKARGPKDGGATR